MRETNLAELRKNTKDFFDSVEQGDIVRVYRKGKPIADIVPVPRSKPSWKKEVKRLVIPGLSLSKEILKDRDESV